MSWFKRPDVYIFSYYTSKIGMRRCCSLDASPVNPSQRQNWKLYYPNPNPNKFANLEIIVLSYPNPSQRQICKFGNYTILVNLFHPSTIITTAKTFLCMFFYYFPFQELITQMIYFSASIDLNISRRNANVKSIF